MAQYKISGVWKDSRNVITHYAFHEVLLNSVSKATKKSKTEAVALLRVNANSAVTLLWNYTKAEWVDGERVEVVGIPGNEYLRSNRDNRLTDNLAHLINFDKVGL